MTARCAFLTGASRGIGWELAQAFVRDGWSLGVLGRDEDALQRSVDRLRALTPTVERDHDPVIVGAAADVADYAAVESAVNALHKQLGAPTVLVNNAGVIEDCEVPIWEADPAAWARVVDVNLVGVFNVVRATVPLMLASPTRPLRVINLSTGAAIRDAPIYSAYHAAKTGMTRITGSLHLAGESQGLLAFDVSPGVVRTQMTASMAIHDDRQEWTDVADVAALVLAVAAGQADEWSGRHLRSGLDSAQSLREIAAAELPLNARKLRLQPWGDGDPLP